MIDIRLPDMEGIELLTAIKETTPKMVKLILTGYPEQQSAVEACNRGAHGYVLKPINIDYLLDIIEERLRERQEVRK